MKKSYYEILQVDQRAEQEVIEGAYRKLAKKYHPDSNPSGNASEIMILINEAYQHLKNKEKRKEYDYLLTKKTHVPFQEKKDNLEQKEFIKKSEAAGKALYQYFDQIKDKKYTQAYRFICESDRKKIKAADFVSWQSAVSKIFKIKKVAAKEMAYEKNIMINSKKYAEMIEFTVLLLEENLIMNQEAKDLVVKRMVFEKNEWRVFLGYEDLQPLIAKYNDLANLITFKDFRNYSEYQNSYQNVSGLVTIDQFAMFAEKEIIRYERYGNSFSLMMIETHNLDEKQLIQAANMLVKNMRKLDLVCRWTSSKFLIIMPETDAKAALFTSNKVQKLFSDYFNADPNKLVYFIATDVFTKNLSYTIGCLENQILELLKNKFQSIISSGGYNH